MRTGTILLLSGLITAACSAPAPQTYDLVVASGRVMDPESGLHAVRHLGIRGGTFARTLPPAENVGVYSGGRFK